MTVFRLRPEAGVKLDTPGRPWDFTGQWYGMDLEHRWKCQDPCGNALTKPFSSHLLGFFTGIRGLGEEIRGLDTTRCRGLDTTRGLGNSYNRFPREVEDISLG